MSNISIYQTLTETGLPCAYSHFTTRQDPPFLVYFGEGQEIFLADDTHYHTKNNYQIQYYYKKKNEENEAAIEAALLSAGYLYEKSEDIFVEEQNVFVIYYYV